MIVDVTAKSCHPLEEGEPCIFNYLKKIDFRLRGNDTQILSRLFAVASSFKLTTEREFVRASDPVHRTPVCGRKNSDSYECEQKIPACLQPFVFAIFSSVKSQPANPFQSFRRALATRIEVWTKRNSEFRIDPGHAGDFENN